MSTATVAVSPGFPAHTSLARIPCRFVVPAWVAAIATAVSSVRPPTKVSTSVRIEPASPLDPERAMSMNDASDTSSHARNSRMTSSARTSSRIDNVNAVMMV